MSLLQEVKKSSWWEIWITSVLNFVVVMVAVVISVSMWFSDNSNKEIALLMSMMSIWGAIVMCFEVKLRHGTRQGDVMQSDSIVAFSIKRCETGIAIAKLFAPALIACFIVICIWQLWVYLMMSGKYYKVFIHLSAFWFFLVIVATRIFVRYKQKELKQLRAMLED